MKLRRYQKQLTDKILTTLETENRLSTLNMMRQLYEQTHQTYA